MKNVRAVAVLPLLFALSLRGDTIELKTGEKIDGRFKQANSDGAIIEVGGQSLTIPLDKVRAIYLGAGPNATASGERAPYGEAVDALKALRSVTSSSVSYRDYAPRVLDAKVKVDKYLSSPGGDDARRDTIRAAMQYYELAATAWNAEIVKDYDRAREVGQALQNPALAECPTVKKVIAESEASAERISNGTEIVIGRMKYKNPPPPLSPGETREMHTKNTAAMFTGNSLGQQPGLLWSCAASKIEMLEGATTK